MSYWPPPPGFDPHLARWGHPKTPELSALILAAAFIGSAAIIGDASGPLFLGLSLAPVALVIFLVVHSGGLPLSLALEQLWAGAILSITAASVLEVLFQLQTRHIWSCQAHSPDVACDVKFILVVIAGVGVVEESAKLLPMSRVHISWLHYLTSHQWWFRLVDAPRSYALAGLCGAAGFAAVENVKYVFAEGTTNHSLGTSFWRALLAIPFHLACTTYAVSTVASFVFTGPSEDWGIASDDDGRKKPGDVASEGVVDEECPPATTDDHNIPAILPIDGIASNTGATSIGPIPPHTTPLLRNNTIVAVGYEGRDWRWEPFQTLDPNIIVWIVALFLPSLLHGIYDAGLFLAVQFVSHTDSNPQNAPLAHLIRTIASRVSVGPMVDGAAAHSVGVDVAYQTLALLCVGLSFASYLTIISLAIHKFRSLPESPPL